MPPASTNSAFDLSLSVVSCSRILYQCIINATMSLYNIYSTRLWMPAKVKGACELERAVIRQAIEGSFCIIMVVTICVHLM